MSGADWTGETAGDIGDDGDVPDDPLLEGGHEPGEGDLGDDAEEETDGVA